MHRKSCIFLLSAMLISCTQIGSPIFGTAEDVPVAKTQSIEEVIEKTLLGAALGKSLLDSLTVDDLNHYHKSSQKAMEDNKNGVSLAWTNHTTGTTGTFTPINVYRNDAEQFCREYIQTITILGKEQKGYGKACREDGGIWNIEE